MRVGPQMLEAELGQENQVVHLRTRAERERMRIRQGVRHAYGSFRTLACGKHGQRAYKNNRNRSVNEADHTFSELKQ